MLSTNHKPVVRGTDEGIWRRLRLVPFSVTIPPAERDQRLPDRLRAELPGVLAWAVRGAAAWYTRGLGTARAVEQATDAYRVESDVLGAFLAEECVQGDRVSAPSAFLHQAYSRWAAEHGETQLSQTALGRLLTERGYPKRQAGATRTVVYDGIGLRAPNWQREGESVGDS
jgi:putative DNA primase/helicase